MYRAAIVGCGRIGCAFDDDPRRGYVSTHAGAYKRTPGVELVALSDIDAARLHKYADKFEVCGRYIDFRDMLATERVDILSICTWAGTHRELVDAGVEAGVEAIFCEKPLATNLSDARGGAQASTCAANHPVAGVSRGRCWTPHYSPHFALRRRR